MAEDTPPLAAEIAAPSCPRCEDERRGLSSSHQHTCGGQAAEIGGVRCYSCGHHYTARPDQIKTVCPECGSDSFTRVGAERHAEIVAHEHCAEGACESCDCCVAGWCVAFQDGEPFPAQFSGFSKPYSERLIADAHAEYRQWCDAVLDAWEVEPRPDWDLLCGQRDPETGATCLLEWEDHHRGHSWARNLSNPPGGSGD